MDGILPFEQFLLRFTTAVLSFLLFGAVWYCTKGIGLGDIKYAALLGYLLGPDKLVYAFVATALFGIIVYLIGILLFHWPKTKKIPYAPFLSAGAVFSLFLNIILLDGII